ncbi:hypothetical protein [Kitasatospora aureofaciens]|uniref:hypothetical protein n=1 Tax=Kitasatospora aureofaciens TaxID=1894 RepID=UPI001C457341|nr:hypothetical protein [Kitasatospora aureofaciens]MBV6696767.1 hypothetical protein [Kitasatospora aureofaciens]
MPGRRGRIIAAAAGAACVLAISTGAPAVGAQTPADEPACTGKASPEMQVTGGTVTWCPTAAGGRLTFTNTGRAYRDLSLVIYDCDGGKAPNADLKKCAQSMKSMDDVMWRQIRSKESVHADFDIKKGSNAQVWWTADRTDQATDLKLLGTPWNS